MMQIKFHDQPQSFALSKEKWLQAPIIQSYTD